MVVCGGEGGRVFGYYHINVSKTICTLLGLAQWRNCKKGAGRCRRHSKTKTFCIWRICEVEDQGAVTEVRGGTRKDRHWRKAVARVSREVVTGAWESFQKPVSTATFKYTCNVPKFFTNKISYLLNDLFCK